MENQTIVVVGDLRSSGRTRQLMAELCSGLKEKGYATTLVDGHTETAEEFDTGLNDSCEGSGNARTAVRDLQQLVEVTGRLQDRKMTIELVDSEDVRNLSGAQEGRRLVDAVEKLSPIVTVQISDHHLGYNIAEVLSQGYVKGPDRPAWVSPYGPARKRRR